LHLGSLHRFREGIQETSLVVICRIATIPGKREGIDKNIVPADGLQHLGDKDTRSSAQLSSRST